MVRQMLLVVGVVITLLGAVTSSLAQDKPSPPRSAESMRSARQAEEDTPKEKVIKRRMAKLESLLKDLESREHQKRVKDSGPRRADALATMTQTSRTCLICRLELVETASGQHTTTKYEANECSRWYAEKVEPKHAHVWERSTCTFGSNADGTSRFVACNPGHFPIWQLSPETQLAVYQHFKSPTEARDLFLSLTDAKTYNDRLDEHDRNKGELIVDALEEWEAADFPATWKEWWGKWYGAHVEEHKEYLTWLRADSRLSFWDWKRQRNADIGAAGAAANAKK